MTVYRFEAVERSGLKRNGRIEAETQAAAKTLASAGGARVLWLEPVAAKEPFWQRDLFGSGAVKRADLVSVVKDLATLLGADLTIDRALRLVIRQSPKSMSAILETVLADVLAGLSLSRAFAKHPKAFPREVVEVTAAGELTGTLGRVLGDLAVSLTRAEEIRRTVISALIYPSLLLVMALGIVGLVIGVLVPSLEPLFDQPGVQPPGVIALTRGVETLLANHWLSILVGLGALALLLAYVWRRPRFAALIEAALLRAPLIGPVLVGIEAGRICRTLGTLLGANVAVPTAIAATRLVPKRRAFRAALDEAARRIPEGARLAVALSGLQTLSPLTLQMIATGEEVNRVPDMLMRAAELHEEVVKTRIDRLFTVMTPLVTGLLGIVVGGLILSIMSAIFSVNDLAMR
ncbi:type II secretion system F family protein [Aureimonas pseudogalii]|uniref:Type II secretory pathway component PulF n=1 Tax=Aureimonas pseudogalii TaxID=1744844 RepID=A0A7W6H8Q3_9HYPH|nr:type II secretion system F family protein [Aureimonas pseudogalii]MBB4000653.1 type II secretory pathway component PulF [Aureimonas pseudogalii]